MDELHIIWDRNKELINIQKHGVSFSEAETVFYDPSSVLFDDPDHSDDEDRFLIIGTSSRERVCIVSHCYREDDTVIRIISARKALKDEIRDYHNFLKGAGDERFL